jgi:hypothetical protein
MTRIGRERSSTTTPALSSATATQPAGHSEPGISSSARHGSGVRACFAPSSKIRWSAPYRATLKWPRPDGVVSNASGLTAPRTALSALPAILRS